MLVWRIWSTLAKDSGQGDQVEWGETSGMNDVYQDNGE